MINHESPPTMTGFIEIVPEHQACRVAEDCILVWTECSGCDCGTPVNQKYETDYRERYAQVCEDYQGAVCEMYCPEQPLDCVKGQCVIGFP